MADAILNTSAGYYDISLTDNGQVSTEESFDSPILVSLFTDARASATEVPIARQRRGWIGNIGAILEIGSKIWLLYQRRLTTDTVNAASDYSQQALNWLVEFGYAKSVTAQATRVGVSRCDVLITIERFDSQVESKLYTLWDNTNGN